MIDLKLFKSKNTKLENKIQKPLFARGFRYRLHNTKLPGKPDLYFAKYNAVIFINGCFWHGHGCYISHIPKSNNNFWREKIHKTKIRDSINIKKLNDMQIRVLVIWECAIKKKEIDFIDFIDYIDGWIRGGALSTEMSGNNPMPILAFKI